jgi:CO dehydrogenase maturation factor
MDSMGGNYQYIVMDNEAGMEHLSRRTTQNIDELLLVSNHLVKGVRTIARLKELVDELKLVVRRQSVIINMVPDGIAPQVREELTKLGMEPAAIIPLDEAVSESDMAMRPLLDLPDCRATNAVDALMDELLKNKVQALKTR